MVTELQRVSARPGRTGAVPVVGIGASAGGLEALRALLEQLPGDTGLGFVVIQHLDPITRACSRGSCRAAATSQWSRLPKGWRSNRIAFT